MDVLKELLRMGYNVLQIYDGFYTNEPVKEIRDIVKYKAIKYYRTYIK